MVQRFGDKRARDFFPTLRFEGEIIDCEVEGEIPRDIRGTFYRLGGDWAYPPKFPHDAPFSADGYISMFRFANGRVDYRGRFVRTPRYLSNRKAGAQHFGIYRNRAADDPSVRSLSSTVANTTPRRTRRTLVRDQGGCETLRARSSHTRDARRVGLLRQVREPHVHRASEDRSRERGD